MELLAAVELFQAACPVVTAGRLLGMRSVKRYKALFIYLVFLAAMNLDFAVLSYTSNAYFYSYWLLEPLKLVFSLIAVRELIELIFEDYPGIRTVGRWAMYVAVVMALGISLAATGFFWDGGRQGRSRTYYLEISQRSVLFILALVILALLVTLSRYPLHLRKNTVVSSVSFSALFLGDAARLLIDGFAPPPYLYNRYVDWTESVFAGLCLVAWALLLKPADERVPARITFTTPREDHLLQELTALNQLMARAARR